MKRREFLLKSVMAGAAVSAFPVPALLSAEKQRRVLYFDRSTEYVHPPTIDDDKGGCPAGRALKKIAEMYDCKVDCTKDGTVFDGDLSKYDAFFFYTCGQLDRPGGQLNTPCMTANGVKKFYEAIRSGKSFIGVHSAADTWKTPGPQWENQPMEQRTEYIKMLGGQFIIHGSQQEATIEVTDSTLPWCKRQGKSFRFFDEWYTYKNFNRDMHVVLVQETRGMKTDGGNACYNRPKYPAAWVRMEGKGRVAYSSLGHNAEAWSGPVVCGIVGDLLGFALGLYNMDMSPNMMKVCPDAEVLIRS